LIRQPPPIFAIDAATYAIAARYYYAIVIAPLLILRHFMILRFSFFIISLLPEPHCAATFAYATAIGRRQPS